MFIIALILILQTNIMGEKLSIGLIISALLLIITCQEPAMGQDKEKDAIKTTINRILDAHARSDADAWLGQWVQEPYVFISAADKNGYFYHKGFGNLSELYHGFWPDSVKMDKLAGLKLEPVDFEIEVADHLARATFCIEWSFKPDQADVDTVYHWKSFENYSLEKQEDGWKVAAISAVNLSSYDE